LTVHSSPSITRNLARLDRIMRRELQAMFPALTCPALDAVELLTSWDAWNRLRTAQGFDVAGATEVVIEIVRTLTEGNIE